MRLKTSKLTLMGMLVALSYVGAYIKIPSPFQSIALDSMPAFLGGLMLGGREGAVIGFLGHMITAGNAGFYLTFPVHLLVAVMMALTIYVYHWTYKKTNWFVAGIVGTLLNGVGAPLVLALMPQFGWGFFTAIVPFLTLASAVNVCISLVVFKALKKTKVMQTTGLNYEK